MATKIPSVTVDAHYILDLPLFQTEKPYRVAGPLEPKDEPRRTSAVIEHKKLPFHNLREYEGMLPLKANGFEYMLDKATGVEVKYVEIASLYGLQVDGMS